VGFLQFKINDGRGKIMVETNIDEILNKIGVNGPGREPTKKYGERLINDCRNLDVYEIQLILVAHWAGYLAAKESGS
jgi:hypothetical protein